MPPPSTVDRCKKLVAGALLLLLLLPAMLPRAGCCSLPLSLLHMAYGHTLLLLLFARCSRSASSSLPTGELAKRSYYALFDDARL